MNGADLIAQILKREGVEIIPAFPHSDIIDAGAKLGLRPIIVRQERQALHIADGYARMTGGRRICCTTVQYGPGSENALGAVAQCYADNVPVLHIPGGYPRDAQGVAPNFNAARSLQGITKWCEMVQRAERIPQMMQNAFALLRNGRPGPVVLEVPIDLFTEAVDPALAESYKSQRRSAPAADPREVAELVERLLGAAAPVILAGQGLLYAEAWEELEALAELTQTPVISTLNGKSAFREDHPLALGCAGGARPDGVVRALETADLILGLGTSFTRSDYITPLPIKGRFFAQLTNWEGDISKDYPVDLGVIGDARARLGEEGRRGQGAKREEVAAMKKAFLADWLPLLKSDEVPINPYRVIWDLMACVDRAKTVVTHDAGSPRDQTTAFYEAIVPHGYMGWGKTTQLGMGLGLMQGAKLARPDWTCINIMGDAAIGMVAMDFETGVRNRIGTTTIVLKNAVMGGYRDYHSVAAERYAIHELGGDYAAIARALGGHGERVERPDEIKPALSRALAENAKGAPALIEVLSSEEPRMAKKLPAELG
jgi:acetolactate synthase-1/2/3 large subunit